MCCELPRSKLLRLYAQRGLRNVVNIYEMATLTSKNLFVGFSTVGNTNNNRQLVDLKLVEQDLRNHFFTRKNERLMMPGWGCGIWDYLFEPFDDATQSAILEEVKQVINSDPRVQLQNVNVTTFDHGIRIAMQLYYVPWNAYSNFSIDFDNRSQQLT